MVRHASLFLGLALVGSGVQAPSAQPGGKLVGADAVGTAVQGSSVAISADGTTAIVGGPADSLGTGAVWVWTRGGGTWTQQGGKLVGSGARLRAHQGAAVALSADGNTAVVGGANDNAYYGAAWVFTRNDGVWKQLGTKVVGTGAIGNARQGCSVAISGNGRTIIVGGYRDDAGDGAAWMFARNSAGGWTQLGPKLVGTGATERAAQGISVALSTDGGTAIIGGSNDNGGVGAAWIFVRDSSGTWTQQGDKLVGQGAVGAASQGVAVALSADGNAAIVGGNQDNASMGAAWVYRRIGTTWKPLGEKLVGAGTVGFALQGQSVALSADGTTAIVGGPGDNNGAGAAWVWTRGRQAWTQHGDKLVGPGAVGNATQGGSVGLSGDASTAVVAGPDDGSGIGAVWVFSLSSFGVWLPAVGPSPVPK
jgi:hypothetical protein